MQNIPEAPIPGLVGGIPAEVKLVPLAQLLPRNSPVPGAGRQESAAWKGRSEQQGERAQAGRALRQAASQRAGRAVLCVTHLPRPPAPPGATPWGGVGRSQAEVETADGGARHPVAPTLRVPPHSSTSRALSVLT